MYMEYLYISIITFQTASRADHCDPRGFVQEEIMKKM